MSKRVFVIGDTHFDHKNILIKEKICDDGTVIPCRPYPSIFSMNEDLINNWNQTITSEDMGIVVGDFSFGGAKSHIGILGRLNGYKVLIRGNHDTHKPKWYEEHGFDRCVDQLVLPYNNINIILAHIPIERNEENKEWIIVHGHLHSKVPLIWNDGLNYCVSAENTGYTPVLLDDIITIYKSIKG